MDVKEKMVKLLREAPYNIFDNKLGGMLFDSCLALIADHLIANGVTVQECGNWKYYHKQNKAVCTSCGFERDLDTNFGKAIACPNCGAYMPQPQKEE